MRLCVRTFTTSNAVGSLVRFEYGGYDSVPELRKEMRRRWESSHSVENIEDGVELVPIAGDMRPYTKQHVTLSNDAASN